MREHSPAPRALRTAAAMLAALLLGACTTARDRLEQGVELERAGEAVGATQRYVQALRKDPALAEARTRLAEVAPRALDFHLGQAGRDRLRGDPVAAGESMLAADALLEAVRGVNVPLAVPTDYAARRREALDGAIARLTRDAAAAWGQARWSDALALYDRVAGFDPSPATAASTRDARIHTLIHWADGEVAAGHYRAAVALAERGLAEGGGHAGYADAFESIRDAALHAGTVRVAFLPVSAPGADPRTRGFLALLNDTLELDHWGEPRQFVEPVPAARVRRALRGRHDDARAAAVARRVQADLAVACLLGTYRVEEHGVRERSRSAPTRRGKRVKYTVRSGTRVYRADVRYRIVGRDGRSRPGRTVSTTHRAGFEEAAYPGDPRDLRLGPDERRAFARDPGEQQAAEKVASRLAREVMDALVADLP